MRLLDEQAVERALDYPALIARLRDAFRDGCDAPLRHRHDIGGGIMLIKPAWRDGGPFAVKVINVFGGNAARGLPAVLGAVLLFDGTTGAPIAALDGRSLTVRRTAAASALAADFLARRDAATLLMVGTGQLAPALVRAHATVRRLARVLVWGRDQSKASALADALRREGLPAEPAEFLAPAVAAADVVSCATLASDPLIEGAWLRPGCHVDLVGSFTPDMREADDAVMARARIFVDTREGALAESGDLIKPLQSGAITPQDIIGELAELCRGTVAGRIQDADITVFKSVGTALEDLAAAELAAARAAGG